MLKICIFISLLLLIGCSSVESSKILIGESNKTKWAWNINEGKKVKDTFEYCLNKDCEIEAILYVTSGFHFQNYAVFTPQKLKVTIAYGEKITEFGTVQYLKADLESIINMLQNEGKCHLWKAESHGESADFIAYYAEGDLFICLEDGGYWDEANRLHSWFWGKYGETITWQKRY